MFGTKFMSPLKSSDKRAIFKNKYGLSVAVKTHRENVAGCILYTIVKNNNEQVLRKKLKHFFKTNEKWK